MIESGYIAGSYKEMRVFKISYRMALDIHNISNTFPASERYLLVNQIRRSSRAICANIAEAYGKRRYPKHFISKLSDADSETSETLLWLDFSKDFGYINPDLHKDLSDRCRIICKMLGGMMKYPERFTPKRN